MFLCCFPRRRPSVDVTKTSRNPFFNDLVIEVMLEEATVKTLRTLRNLDRAWNQLAIKELGKRALDGQVYPLDFSEDFTEAQEEFDKFSETTAANPQLFRSFSINFPNSFKFIDVSTFFKKYTPIYLHLKFNFNLKFTDLVTQFLLNIFKWIATTIQELKIERLEEGILAQEQLVMPFSFPETGGLLIFPNLTKIIWDMGDNDDCLTLKTHIPFKYILDKSGPVDPTPNLTTLNASINSDFLKMLNNAPRFSNLVNLRIFVDFECEDNIKIVATLLSLARGGMSLKSFAINRLAFLPAHLSPDMFRDWSYFFATQAKSLQFLELEWFFCEEDSSQVPPIKLPIFERLHTLDLNLEFGISPPGSINKTRMFNLIQFPAHFPSLVCLNVHQNGFLNMSTLDGDPIQSEEITWNSLKVVEICSVEFPLKMAHLTGIRKLIVRDYCPFRNRSVEDYLAFFNEVRSLKLSRINFLWMALNDEVKARFIRQFPFPVKFNQGL